MAKKAAKAPTPPTPYELFGLRIQKEISSPKAQKAVLLRQEGDNPEFWERLLEEISENDNVTVAHRDDGGVNVFWTVPEED